MGRVKMRPSEEVMDNDTMIWCGQGSQSKSRLKNIKLSTPKNWKEYSEESLITNSAVLYVKIHLFDEYINLKDTADNLLSEEILKQQELDDRSQFYHNRHTSKYQV